MKILQISNYLYPHIGGIEQVARDFANASKECNVEQKILCFNHEKGDKVDFVDGVEVHRVGCFLKVASQSLSTHYGKALKRLMKEFNPDVVVFHYPNPFVAFFLLRVLKKYPKCKLVTYWHLDIFKQKILKLFFGRQNKKILKKSIKVVATTDNYIAGSKLLSSVKDKCVVIPNCASDSKITPTEVNFELAKKIREQNEGKTVCFGIGRHIPYKGFEYLVKASKYLDDSFKIYIGGSGPLTESLKTLAKGDNKIEFLGRIDDDALKAYLIACDIFCFPSITKNEAFGIALAEAMAYKKPAITFTIDGSGVNFVNMNKITGLEVPNCDSEKYAMAIKTLSQDELLMKTYGENAKKRVDELFTFNCFKKNTKNLLERISES